MPPPRHLSVSPLARRSCSSVVSRFFVFTATATTQIYTLSLHDALPISLRLGAGALGDACVLRYGHDATRPRGARDRKSTRLNSSHRCISYAVFCLKKKKSRRTQR